MSQSLIWFCFLIALSSCKRDRSWTRKYVADTRKYIADTDKPPPPPPPGLPPSLPAVFGMEDVWSKSILQPLGVFEDADDFEARLEACKKSGAIAEARSSGESKKDFKSRLDVMSEMNHSGGLLVFIRSNDETDQDYADRLEAIRVATATVWSKPHQETRGDFLKRLALVKNLSMVIFPRAPYESEEDFELRLDAQKKAKKTIDVKSKYEDDNAFRARLKATEIAVAPIQKRDQWEDLDRFYARLDATKDAKHTILPSVKVFESYSEFEPDKNAESQEEFASRLNAARVANAVIKAKTSYESSRDFFLRLQHTYTTHPELVDPPQRRLVIHGLETTGRWTAEATKLIRDIAKGARRKGVEHVIHPRSLAEQTDDYVARLKAASFARASIKPRANNENSAEYHMRLNATKEAPAEIQNKEFNEYGSDYVARIQVARTALAPIDVHYDPSNDRIFHDSDVSFGTSFNVYFKYSFESNSEYHQRLEVAKVAKARIDRKTTLCSKNCESGEQFRLRLEAAKDSEVPIAPKSEKETHEQFIQRLGVYKYLIASNDPDGEKKVRARIMARQAARNAKRVNSATMATVSPGPLIPLIIVGALGSPCVGNWL